MNITVIFGAGYSDEGKGICLKRLVNLLAAQNVEFIVQRVNAGSNAGHKIQTQDGRKYISKMMPSAFPTNKITLGIGPQVVINLDVWLEEIQTRPDMHNLFDKTFIHGGAAIVLPGYIAKNKCDSNKAKFGTTNQGTSIVVSERISRRAVVLWDLEDANEEILISKMARSYSELQIPYDDLPSQIVHLLSKWSDIKSILGPNLVSSYQSRIHSNSTHAFIEGCNGALIDTLWGQTPFTTSCMTYPAALVAYSGWSMKHVSNVVAVMGAYLCCLDARIFLTEFDSLRDVDIINKLSIAANEIDTAEDKPRRLGWFDAVSMRTACRDASEVFLTKLDALTGLAVVRVCSHYIDRNGNTMHIAPLRSCDLDGCLPVYVDLPGWDQDITGVTSKTELPTPAIAYVDYIADLVSVPVKYVGTGKRECDFVQWS